MKGYIKLHRTILDWEWYKDTNTKILFIHLLLNACYDSCRFMGKAVKRGDYITSITRLSHDLGLTVRQVRTCLSRLKKTGEIDIQTSNRYTMITICNYESYQVEEPRKKVKATRKRQAVDTQTTDINKNIIKQENKNNMFLQNNNTLYQFNKDNSYTKINGILNKNIAWAKTEVAKKDISNVYLKIHQGNGVSILKILTELHNGKFFGSILTFILFISSLSLIFLTLSSFIFGTKLLKNKKNT